MDEEEILIETWTVLKQYIKDKQSAADQWVGILIDAGVGEETFHGLAAFDKYLENAVKYNVEIEEEEEEYDDD